jgi:Mg2+ and Co2+ transporter CorA
MSLLKNTSKLLLLQYQDYLKNLKNNCKKELKNYNHNYGHLNYDVSDNIIYGYESVINDVQWDIYQIYSNINNYKKGL